MTSPRVTVVIPTYRGGRYLREAVGSVVDQTFKDWDLVVVSDGCDEDMTDLTELDARINVLRQKNRGESVARNVGIRAAESDLVAFLDDDDRMMPDRLEAQVAAMSADPAIGICHTQFRVIDSIGRVADLHEASPNRWQAAHVQYDDLLRAKVGILMPTTMMRRSLVEEVGTFDSTLRTGQDLELIYRVARESRLHLVPEMLTEYRRHESNASGDAFVAGTDLERLLRRHLRLAEINNDQASIASASYGIEVARKFAAQGAIDRARSAWRHGDMRTLAENLGRALERSPAVTFADVIGNRQIIRMWTHRE